MRTVSHQPAGCAVCGQTFAEGSDYRLREAHYELELEVGSVEVPRLQV
ncbi:MAG: hypothetical protein JXB29_08635 [Sedimentisphaerales bacterium]|nr:hypothetical protein [Sedimentisphaerales bacterium]